MKVTDNISAYIARNCLSNSDNALGDALEKLSSGFKINHAKDNPAGIAMARKMKDQINSLNKANQNAADGVSVIETAEGALTEVHSMLQRMNELAVKSSNGLYSDEDRKAIQNEIDQLKDEVVRIAESTDFNEKSLLGGDLDLRGYTDTNNAVVPYYSDQVPANLLYSVEVTGYNAATNEFTIGTLTGFPSTARVEMDGNRAIIKADNGFEVQLTLKAPLQQKDNSTPPVMQPVGYPHTINLDLTGRGAMGVQVGANEGQTLDVRIPKLDLQQMSLDKVDLATEDTSRQSIEYIKDAVAYVSEARSRLGAYQNRLESTMESLEITSESMTKAYSRIMDTDMAEEMTQYTSQQVLVQAGTSILAQANERPQSVLQLLQ